VNISSFSNPSSASLYSDFTGLIINLTPGSTNSYSLTPRISTTRNYWRIWIDFNNDGDFTDSGEQVVTVNNKRGTASGTFTIPSDVSGTTRMRVTEKNGGIPSSCEVFTNGEVEDYTVSFTNAPVFEKPLYTLDLNIYPNPASHEINVALKTPADKVNIKLYNALGQILIDFNTEGKQASIDLDKYPAGIYFIGADDGSQTTLKKFIRK
jgi:hypothetical protein